MYQQQHEDAGLSARLTLMELPNLIEMLRHAEERETQEATVHLAHNVERLLSTLGRPQALAEASAVRQRAEARLGDWGYSRFLAAGSEVERLLEHGEMQEARAAVRLLEHSLKAGEGAYQRRNTTSP